MKKIKRREYGPWSFKSLNMFHSTRSHTFKYYGKMDKQYLLCKHTLAYYSNV